MLPEAEKRYATGNFDELLEILLPCVENGFNENGRVQAYKILVRTYLAMDSVSRATETIRKILVINPQFEPEFSASDQFKNLVQDMKDFQEKIMEITSVSKKAENLLQVPATVMVLTEKDIVQRGYQSLEEMLHDLPGFDIAKGNGPGYAYFYQRGYRAISNDRILLLIDGVEENDLVSNNIPISRQYPIADVARVEVIYGPASTLYGANAFSGVINVITKSYAKSTGTNKKLAFTGQTRGGTWNTGYFDGILTGKTKDVAVSVIGRYYRSDEMDLSRNSDTWNYDPRTAGQYNGLLDMQGQAANKYLNSSGLLTKFPNSSLFTVDRAANGDATAIRLTSEGRQKAAELDNQGVFDSDVTGEPVQFDNKTSDFFVRVKVEFKELTLSGYSWKTNEGATPWYTNKSRLSAPNRSRWITANNAFSSVYNKTFSERFQVLNITSFKIHEIEGGTNLASYSGYYNNRYSLLDLANGRMPVTSTQYFYRYSNQLRNELRYFLTPSPQLEVSGGLEIRASYIQGDYIRSARKFPDETGYQVDSIVGGNNYRSYDLGLYSQLTYRPVSYLKMVGGLRLDNNRIRNLGGYGTVFNPRLAVVYIKDKYIFKAIYATAFKDASNLQKYGTAPDRQLNNPRLQPERAQNIEVSGNLRVNKDLSFNVVAYRAIYSSVIGTARVQLPDGSTTTQFQPLGRQLIYGLQGEGSYKTENLNIWGNFTVAKPLDLETNQRISDIADFQFNLGGNYQITEKLSANLTTNYVSARKTGAGTFGSNNPITRFNPYLILNSTITYQNIVRGVSLQLTVNNIANTEYFVPGVRTADGTTFASRFPQERRYVSVGALFNFE
ncbi:TonB-dependent receptor plug domain-containing protein [Persicitalea sp.]|uniref:TonB-dependent receptor plug domain-containing protein n=1 Tax=Persicitalea sp. TaxID=3100273 RepID=UPI003593B9F6